MDKIRTFILLTLILKVLSEGAIGFADLKKKTDIESSEHLQRHLINSLKVIRII